MSGCGGKLDNARNEQSKQQLRDPGRNITIRRNGNGTTGMDSFNLKCMRWG